jgi:hypothetical protein
MKGKGNEGVEGKKGIVKEGRGGEKRSGKLGWDEMGEGEEGNIGRGKRLGKVERRREEEVKRGERGKK